jgi:hypothetical protein
MGDYLLPDNNKICNITSRYLPKPHSNSRDHFLQSYVFQ